MEPITFGAISAAIITELIADAVSGATVYLYRKVGSKSDTEYRREYARLIEAYAARFITRHDLVVAPARVSRPVKLTKIYVPTQVRSIRQSMRTLAIKEVEKELFQGESPVQAEDGLLLVESEPRLLVLGRAGAGKSAFLRVVGLDHLGYLRGKVLKPRIPFLIDARDFLGSSVDIIQYMIRILSFGGSWRNPDFFIHEEILRKSKGILMWDGLDEIHPRDLFRILNSISDISAAYPNCPQIVACRTAAYQDFHLPSFKEVEIVSFNPSQVEDFVRKWFGADLAKRRLVLQRIEDAGLAQQLFNSPLLLTLQCLAADEDIHSFQSSASLFRRTTEALLKTWDDARALERDQPYRDLNARNKRLLLSRMALAGLESGVYAWPERDLANVIVREMSRLLGVKEEILDGVAILRSIEEQHGLLEQRARSVWAFSHLSLQEYFAATALKTSDLQSLVANRIEDPAWQDTLILAMGLEDDASPVISFLISDIREGIKARNLPIQLRSISDSCQYSGTFSPVITRASCLWFVLHQLLHLAALVDQRLAEVTQLDRTELSQAMRLIVKQLGSEDDFQDRLTGLYVKVANVTRRNIFLNDPILSYDRITELLRDTIENLRTVRKMSLYDGWKVSPDILEYFDLSTKKTPAPDSFLGRWDNFRVFGKDVVWVLRKLLLCCEIVHSGVVMTTNLRHECVEGLVHECMASLAME
jgi:hypothetical protein